VSFIIQQLMTSRQVRAPLLGGAPPNVLLPLRTMVCVGAPKARPPPMQGRAVTSGPDIGSV
jgi:hypothetical protein